MADTLGYGLAPPEATRQAGPASAGETAGTAGPDRQLLIRRILGVIWILDALLQLQPKMLTKHLVTDIIAPNLSGQPAPMHWVIATAMHLMRGNVVAWDLVIFVVQAGIGIGLLAWREPPKWILGVLVAWAVGVWAVGEGLGEILTGSSNPLTGAPGAVLLYAVIAVVAWPVASDAARQGLDRWLPGSDPVRRAKAALGAWAGYWTLMAILWLLPNNRAAGTITGAITGVTDGQPSWYAHFLNTAGSWFNSGHGAEQAWVIALVSLVIGLGPLTGKGVRVFLALGALVQLGFWLTGEAAGALMTGLGTDLNSGPIVMLMGLQADLAVRDAGPELFSLPALRRQFPQLAAAAAALVLALAIVAGYPTPSGASSSSPVTGSGGGGGVTAATSGSSSMAGMDMGSTNPSWSYTGAPLPAGEVSLLNNVGDSTSLGHVMQTPKCTTSPTPGQLQAAMTLVQTTSAALAKYRSLAAATADGYVPITDPQYPIVHYIKWANVTQQHVLDPQAVQSLVYATTPQGPVLVAAMYMMPNPNATGPMPGGCLTQWHQHNNLCMGSQGIQAFSPCPPGTHLVETPPMLHVWQVPVPGGPLALDPTDLEVMEAAVMAQDSGSAPVSLGAGWSPPPNGLGGTFGAAPTS